MSLQTDANCPYTAATCPPGTYISPPATCAACPLGTFSAAPGAAACTACAAGSTTAAPGAGAASLCVPCPLASYCPGGVAAQPCAPGLATAALGANDSSACQGCPPGQHSAGALLACAPCPAGSYCTGAAPRVPCPPHTFCSALGCSAACAPCPAGYSAPAGGAAVCSPTVYDPSAPPLANSSLFCNASVALSVNVTAARVIAFPPGAGVTEAVPLTFLPAVSPLNTLGVDIIVASPSACAAFNATVGAGARCDASRLYSLPSGVFYYLGTAQALGMTAAPSCGS